MATTGLVSTTNTERDKLVSARLHGNRNLADSEETERVTGRLPSGTQMSAFEFYINDASRIELELEDEPLIHDDTLNVTGASEDLDRYRNAECSLRDAVRRITEEWGPDHPKAAEAHQELGDILCRAGLHAESRAEHSQALGIFMRLYGDTHRSIAVSKAKLGLTFLHAGDDAGAVKLYEDSQRIYTDLQADSCSDFANNLNNLGGVRLRHGQNRSAIDNFLRALEIWQKYPIAIHPDIALANSNLGTAYVQSGALDKAESFYRTALDLRRKLYHNSNHIAVAVTLNNLAILLRGRGNLTAAETLLREALVIRRRVCQQVSPSVATGLHNLAVVLRDNGNLLGAEEVYRDSLVARSVLQGDDHPNVAITRANLAEILAAQGRHEEALREASAALLALRKTLDSTHWRVAAANGIKGIALARRGDFAAAESFIVDAFMSIRAARGDQSMSTQRALQRVIQLYQDWGKADRVAEYRAIEREMSAQN